MIRRGLGLDSIVAPRPPPPEFFNTLGYKRLSGPCPEYFRFRAESGPRRSNVSFRGWSGRAGGTAEQPVLAEAVEKLF